MRTLCIALAAAALVACSAPSGAQESEQPQEERPKETAIAQGQYDPVEDARQLFADLKAEDQIVRPLVVLDIIENIIEQDGVRPEDFGASRYELDQMRTEFHMVDARKCLDWLRQGIQPERKARCIANNVAAGTGRYEDIGTTRVEILILATCAATKTCLDI